MAAMVRDLGWTAESVDYRGLDDPAARVRRLIEQAGHLAAPVVLVGSSMGAMSRPPRRAGSSRADSSYWHPPFT
jgi:hypothetical protein